MSRCPPRGDFRWHKWWEGYCISRHGWDANTRFLFKDAATRYRRLLLARPRGGDDWRAFKDGVRDGLDDHRARVA